MQTKGKRRKHVARKVPASSRAAANAKKRPDGAAPAQGTAQWRTLPDASSPSVSRLEAIRPDVGRADEVGRMLQLAFGQLLRHLPARVGKIAQVARWLDLDRSICQRVVMGVRDAADGLGVLERFPGVRGLEQFVEAAESRGCSAEAAREARKALEAYAQLVSDAGGSQTRLVEHIEGLRARNGAHRGAPGAADLERWRRRNYESAVGLTGLSSDARVEVVILGPGRDGKPGQVTTVSATGMIGVESAPYAMPLTRRSRLAGLTPVPEPSDTGAPQAKSGLTPDLLLKPFTSNPPPRVTTRTEGEFLLQIFNIENGTDAPIDITAALAFSWSWENPRDPAANYYSVGRIIGPPTRKLVFDLYLHRSLPAPSAVTAHVLRPGTQGSLGDARPQSRWFDRLPIECDLLLLGGEPGDRPSAAYPRLGELTRYLLGAMNWEQERFTGYRFELSYPLFDMEYIIAAEF